MDEAQDNLILTAEGGEHHINDEVRQYLCYYADGRLLVSKTHMSNPHVLSFEGLMRRLGKPVNKIPTDLDGIRAAYEGGKTDVAVQKEKLDDTKMMQEVATLLQKAVNKRASDIHVRVARNDTKIWFRVHGDMLNQEQHTNEYGEKLCSTIYTAMTDVSDTAFKPRDHQDARIADAKKLPKTLHGVRISTSPTVDGFLMVLRLLYNDAGKTNDLNHLGWGASHSAQVKLMKARPTGLNIICGPTGSGKSTTLQRVLSSLINDRNQSIHVITVEDPPEYPIYGAVQTPVTNCETAEERSRAFQASITAAMRLDPDVIMISEVRDMASAEAAMRAAMTGHQVWTTIHANNAMAIVDRLVDLGLPISLVADHSVITGLMCQRLVKVLCPECKVSFLDAVEAKQFPRDFQARVERVTQINKVFVTGEGCPHCEGSGTIGRTALVEAMIPDPRFMQMIREGKKIEALEYWRKDQRGKTLLEHAIDKINDGIIDPFSAEEVAGPLTMEVMLEDNRLEIGEVIDAVG